VATVSLLYKYSLARSYFRANMGAWDGGGGVGGGLQFFLPAVGFI
jgi:hypothetical protein